ncbi:MAG TPA: hypothetical protein VE082_00360, partial [Desulfobaccales bacterium]|nr:hypothetical protein [Desulfobaccales bacterium]
HQVPSGPLEGFAVVAVGHFVSEAVFMEPWAQQLRELFQAAPLSLEVMVAAEQTPPCFYK